MEKQYSKNSLKKFIHYLIEFHKDYFDLKTYLIIVAFVALLIGLNYTYDIESKYINHFKGKNIRILMFFAYHFIAYIGTLIIIKLNKTKYKLLLSKEFWIKAILVFFILGFSRAFYNHFKTIKELCDPETYRFYYKIANNAIDFFNIFLPLLFLRYLFDIKNKDGIYGLKFSGVSFRPYIIGLCIMIPFVYLASLTKDFQNYYPVYKRSGGGIFSNFYQIPEMVSIVIFEFFYISSFVFVELFFRGALVIGFVKLLGKNCVLPMAATYVVLHFGKPIGETISSFFGGYILGIWAYYSRNIWGGVFIHGGIALLMEIFAFPYFSGG